MGKLSVEQALRDMQRFAALEWRLAVPVALAFFGLPQLVVALLLVYNPIAIPQTVAQFETFGARLPGWWGPMMLVNLGCGLVGALALITLALVPRVSVGEAIVLGFRRAPAWLAAAALLGVALLVALVVLLAVLSAIGAGPMSLAWLTMIAMALAALFLLLLLPLAADRPTGPIALLRHGWRLYRPALGRLAASILLFVAGAWLVSILVQVTLGSVILLAARALGQAPLGLAVVALVAAGLWSLQWAAFHIFVAGLYRQRLRVA